MVLPDSSVATGPVECVCLRRRVAALYSLAQVYVETTFFASAHGQADCAALISRLVPSFLPALLHARAGAREVGQSSRSAEVAEVADAARGARRFLRGRGRRGANSGDLEPDSDTCHGLSSGGSPIADSDADKGHSRTGLPSDCSVSEH